ncbi:MAG: hypothetical protein AB8G16_16185 [Gammaproteobacteria bacterium]
MTQNPIDDHRAHYASDDPDFTTAVLAHFNVNSKHTLEMHLLDDIPC